MVTIRLQGSSAPTNSQLLRAIYMYMCILLVCGNIFVFPQDSAHAHRHRELLRQSCDLTARTLIRSTKRSWLQFSNANARQRSGLWIN